MNHNAASLLLSLLFQDQVLKMSYYQDKKYYSVTVAEDIEPAFSREAAEKFASATGWALVVNGTFPIEEQVGRRISREDTEDADFFLPEDTSVPMAEQNAAFLSIDRAFAALPHRPDKKSLRQDSQGKYLETAFISPMVGERYRDILQALANETGWRLHISEKINQNKLFKKAQILCMEHGVTLIKNPSYLPEKKQILLKTDQGEDKEKLCQVEESFLEQTGCGCSFA